VNPIANWRLANMKNAALPIVTLLLSAIVVACSETPAKVWQTEAVENLNLEKGVALRGYDAVAYFTEGGAVMGDPAVSYQWQGATWQFLPWSTVPSL
jgi:hypothetical protein